jgi:hypothetical protein
MYSTVDKRNQKIVLEGVLAKRGFWNPDFKERYFVLTRNGDVWYFLDKSQKDCPEQALGVIHLGSKTTLASVAAKDGSKSAEILLSVSRPETTFPRAFVLQATTQKAQEDWIDAFQQILDKKEAPPPAPVKKVPVPIKHSVVQSMGRPRHVTPKKPILWFL